MTEPAPATPQPEAQAPAVEPSLGQEQAAATEGETAAFAAPGGYLDNPIPMTTFRERFDSAWNSNRPDRAAYIYGAWNELSFHPHAVQGTNGTQIFNDPHNRGPSQLPGELNFQELSTYVEYAWNHKLSVFADVPWRWDEFHNNINDDSPGVFGGPKGAFPEPKGNTDENGNNHPNGISDLQLGFKYAVVARQNQYLTFQFRTYIPTGDELRGLGTGHVSLEPGLLYYQKFGDRTFVQGQFTTWVPIGGGPIAGDILTYGAGVGYQIYSSTGSAYRPYGSGGIRVVPIAEFLGWTVLNGYESVVGPGIAPPGSGLPANHGVASAAGDTIVNAKLGCRIYFGRASSFYAGFGQALTTARWYDQIARIEYRLAF